MKTNKYRSIAEKYEGSVCGTLKILMEAYQKGSTVQDVIKLGGDTDSNGALYGALYYATRKIPTEYIANIRGYKNIAYYISKLMANSIHN
jgi:ADP-ribosylglycohydrolase